MSSRISDAHVSAVPTVSCARECVSGVDDRIDDEVRVDAATLPAASRLPERSGTSASARSPSRRRNSAVSAYVSSGSASSTSAFSTDEIISSVASPSSPCRRYVTVMGESFATPIPTPPGTSYASSSLSSSRRRRSEDRAPSASPSSSLAAASSLSLLRASSAIRHTRSYTSATSRSSETMRPATSNSIP